MKRKCSIEYRLVMENGKKGGGHMSKEVLELQKKGTVATTATWASLLSVGCSVKKDK